MWYENNYRRIFMDMHLSDDKPDTYLSKLDTDAFANSLKESGASCVVVKAKSHVGLHYWKCRTGRMHEGLRRRDLDYLGEMIEKCHKRGIAVMTYLSQNYDNYAYDTHPEWRTVSKDGKNSRDCGSRYGLVCLNNLEYRAYVKEILTELTENYNYDGIFLDMPFWTEICHCETCKKRYFEETGREIPENENWNDPMWLDYITARSRWLREFMYENTKTIKDIRSDVSIEHNMAAIGYNWFQANDESQIGASDYTGGDYYGGYAQQTFICKYYNSITPNKPFCYITSRCDPSLYFHTVTRSMQDLLIHAMNALVHNGAFSICDAMNPDGTITDEIYSGVIKDVFSITSNYEKYVSGDITADVAVLYPTDLKANGNFISSPMNVGEIMREYNVPYNVIGCENISNMNERVLCICDPFTLSESVCADIADFVNKGGKLFITGHLPCELLENICGIKIIAQSEYDYCYLRPNKGSEQLFETFNDKSPYPIQSRAWEAKVIADNTEILAYLSYPYTKPSEREFAAIHSNPPGTNTDMPAVIRRRCGNGEVIWMCAPAELTKAYNCRRTVYRLIKSLCEKFSAYAYAPEFCEIVHWKKNGKRYFSVINEQNVTPCFPISGITVTLPYHAENIRLLAPHDIDIKSVYDGENTIISIPELDVFHIVEFDMKETEG